MFYLGLLHLRNICFYYLKYYFKKLKVGLPKVSGFELVAPLHLPTKHPNTYNTYTPYNILSTCY